MPGLHVCAGDDAGKIWVYDVGEALACPDSAEWGKFSHTLHDIKANKAGGGAGGIAGLDDETGLSFELFLIPPFISTALCSQDKSFLSSVQS